MKSLIFLAIDGDEQYSLDRPEERGQVEILAFICLSPTDVQFFGYRGTEINDQFYGIKAFDAEELLITNHNKNFHCHSPHKIVYTIFEIEPPPNQNIKVIFFPGSRL